MKIAEDLYYVGVNDHDIDLFESQYPVPNGMAYNSYVLVDEKIAVMDSVEARFGEEWMEKIAAVLDGRTPDYLVVQHMEPDHSANISRFMDAYPEAVMVASPQAFTMLKQFYGVDYAERKLVVHDHDTLSLGQRTLTFVVAAMVHWPEVIMTYDDKTRTIFTADAFGKFGALDVEEDDWACEARRYYFGICGKYGQQVMAVLKKISVFRLRRICPLHGPVLDRNLDYYLDLYLTWSSYKPEDEGVAICYTSVYGHTKEAAELLASKLRLAGKKVAICDLARSDMAEALEDAFRYSKLVLASTTYNMGVFPYMSDFISLLVEHGYTRRRVGIIENGSWSPAAARVMKSKFEKAKGIDFCETTVTLRGALSEESRAQLFALADELM